MAGEAFQCPSAPEERDAMLEAEDALCSWLADGALEVKALKKLAQEADMGWRTLERAKRCLRVKTEKRGGPGNKNGPWMWRLSGEDRLHKTAKPLRRTSLRGITHGHQIGNGQTRNGNG